MRCYEEIFLKVGVSKKKFDTVAIFFYIFLANTKVYFLKQRQISLLESFKG